MSQKVSKSAGWKFQPKKATSLIVYTGDFFDEADRQNLKDLTEQLQDSDTEDISSFLRVVPPVDQLIQQIPFSLGLLETLYLKCELAYVEGKIEFPKAMLSCEQLFCQLLWWSAYSEQKNLNACLNKRIPTLQELERPVASILQVLNRNFPGLVERAQADRAQLAACLESLGCHGLVNCSSGLIRMSDAVHHEVLRHSERIKTVAVKVKELSDTKKAVDPSTASHQRQMSLKLSEVFERLKLNECIECSLEEAINNAHLNSLLRIVRKRVASDRLLIGLFNAFTRSAPDDFGFEQLDPIVAKLIVVFNNAYDKLLSMCPTGDCDSGCFGDSSTEGRRSLDETIADSPERRRSSGRDSGKADSLIRKKENGKAAPKTSPLGRRFRGKRPAHHSSLKDLNMPGSLKMSAARSLGNIVNDAKEQIEAKNVFRSTQSLANNENEDVQTECRLQRLHISHLKNELSRAHKQVQHLQAGNNNLFPAPDYPNASSYYNTSSKEDIIKLLGKFSELYIRARHDIQSALNSLPEFAGSEELQQKTVLSCAVLTYRSVVDCVQRKRERIWDIIQEGEAREQCDDSEELDFALYRHMYRRAKSQHGMQNAKEVTSQIWKTLYDFPSLKTCTIFNRFVLECCDLAWDIVAGVEGRKPRLRLEYEAVLYDTSRHSRSNDSAHGNEVRQVLWPALIDTATEKCLLKADHKYLHHLTTNVGKDLCLERQRLFFTLL